MSSRSLTAFPSPGRSAKTVSPREGEERVAPEDRVEPEERARGRITTGEGTGVDHTNHL